MDIEKAREIWDRHMELVLKAAKNVDRRFKHTGGKNEKIDPHFDGYGGELDTGGCELCYLHEVLEAFDLIRQKKSSNR